MYHDLGFIFARDLAPAPGCLDLRLLVSLHSCTSHIKKPKDSTLMSILHYLILLVTPPLIRSYTLLLFAPAFVNTIFLLHQLFIILKLGVGFLGFFLFATYFRAF